MKKALAALGILGSMFVAFGHGGGGVFNTDDASVVCNKEFEIGITGVVELPEHGEVGANLGITYGIGDRFQIGIENGFYVNKEHTDEYYFSNPELSLKFTLIEDVFAMKTFLTPGANSLEFGGMLIYSLEIPSFTKFNFNAGFESEQGAVEEQEQHGEEEHGHGSNHKAFTYSFSVIQPINKFFLGAELFGEAFKDIDDDEKKPNWRVGAGYNFDTIILSLGFGGSFVSNDDLKLKLGLTFFFGGDH